MAKNMDTSMKERIFPRYRLGMGIWDGLQNGKIKMENHSVNLKTAEL